MFLIFWPQYSTPKEISKNLPRNREPQMKFKIKFSKCKHQQKTRILSQFEATKTANKREPNKTPHGHGKKV